MNIKYKELREQPNGVIFYEDDIAASQLFQKVATIKDDIVVRQFDNNFEQSRMGFAEMDMTDINSKEYHVFGANELGAISEFIELAHLAVKQK